MVKFNIFNKVQIITLSNTYNTMSTFLLVLYMLLIVIFGNFRSNFMSQIIFY